VDNIDYAKMDGGVSDGGSVPPLQMGASW